MKTLTFYEQCGIVIPGAVFLFGLALLSPTIKTLAGGNGITVGGLGVFLLLAYAAGHAVAAVGNILEKVLWFFFGGMPSNWVTHSPPKLLNATQIQTLSRRMDERLGTGILERGKLTKTEWLPLFGQIYRDALATNPGRIETFNAVYGLNRGLAAAVLALIPAVTIAQPVGTVWIAIGLGGLGIIYLYRMYRFGVHFAKEVYFSFLNRVPAESPLKGGSSEDAE